MRVRDDGADVWNSENLHVNYAEELLSCLIVKSLISLSIEMKDDVAPPPPGLQRSYVMSLALYWSRRQSPAVKRRTSSLCSGCGLYPCQVRVPVQET
jgi:hypothetical protein